MLVGHYAPALAARPHSGRLPLWALVLGVQAVDVLFFGLVLAGVESASVEPGRHPRLIVTDGVWSHSLLMTAVYFAVCAAVGWAIRRPREGVALGVAVASHWLTDLLVHVPDLPVGLAQEPSLGLGLWRWPLLATGIELGLVVAASAYLARGWAHARRLWVFTVGLVGVQLLGDFVVPAPESDAALAPSAFAVYALATAGAWWVERGRAKIRPAPAAGVAPPGA